jgi:prolyl-tRNA synthetase
MVKLFSASTILKKSTVGYYARLLLGYAFIFNGENIKSVKGCINYLNHKKIDNIQVVYFQIKKTNRKKYRELFSTFELLWLTSEEIYKDIDYSSTSESMFIIVNNHSISSKKQLKLSNYFRYVKMNL